MKGNIFEIKRFAVHDGDGIRTTVFLKGCPLKCVWCHNPEGICPKPQLGFYKHKCVNCGMCTSVCACHTMKDGIHIFEHENCIACGKCVEVCPAGALEIYGREVTVEEILPTLLEDKAFYDNSGGGVTLSGGECLCQAQFCKELLKALKENGVNTAVDTCGFVAWEAIEQVLPFTDVFLFDVKAYDEETHIRCTGQSNRLILENLRRIDAAGKTIEVRIPFVPEYNADQIPGIAGILKELKHLCKVRVLPYHNYAGSKYAALHMENTLPPKLPEQEALEEAREILMEQGIKVVQ